jgi:hypothetical protein
MAKQIINVGTGPNTKNGDPIRNAFQKVNANFTELYDGLASIEIGEVSWETITNKPAILEDLGVLMELLALLEVDSGSASAIYNEDASINGGAASAIFDNNLTIDGGGA